MADSNRGLGSADEDTREDVARQGGQASHGGGRKGGQSSDPGKTNMDNQDMDENTGMQPDDEQY